jgi:osmoprotectant transport system permease protein
MLFASFSIHDLVNAWERSQDTFWPQTFLFLSLTLRALGLALLVGLPAGIALTRFPRLASPIIDLLGVLQTIQPLVLRSSTAFFQSS